jgi:hypothetical protein
MRTNSTKIAYSTLIATGTTALALSIIYESSILAFIGLGLLFWGIIFTYIHTEEYTKKALLDATISSQTTTLNQITQELDYKGTTIYLPPKFFKGTETLKAFIPKQQGAKLPTPEQIQAQENQIFLKNPQGLLLTPLGAELTKLFEKTLETDFTRVDLRYLQQKTPKLFIENLEIAQNLTIDTENNLIHIKIQNLQYKTPIRETDTTSHSNFTFDSPISSAIACALAKTTGKPVIIEKQQASTDGKDLTIDYRILEEEE